MTAKAPLHYVEDDTLSPILSVFVCGMSIRLWQQSWQSLWGLPLQTKNLLRQRNRKDIRHATSAVSFWSLEVMADLC